MNISIHVDPEHDGVDFTASWDDIKLNVTSIKEATKWLETFDKGVEAFGEDPPKPVRKIDEKKWREWSYETFAAASPHLMDSDGKWIASVKNVRLVELFTYTPALVRLVIDAINYRAANNAKMDHPNIHLADAIQLIRDMGFGEDLEVDIEQD